MADHLGVGKETVYGWRGRCGRCHYADNPSQTSLAPRWISIGDCEVASLRTLHTVICSGYLDPTLPARSLLLLKPLAERAGGVEHGGGDKFHDAQDPAYLDFIAFIERYRVCDGGEP